MYNTGTLIFVSPLGFLLPVNTRRVKSFVKIHSEVLTKSVPVFILYLRDSLKFDFIACMFAKNHHPSVNVPYPCTEVLNPSLCIGDQEEQQFPLSYDQL